MIQWGNDKYHIYTHKKNQNYQGLLIINNIFNQAYQDCSQTCKDGTWISIFGIGYVFLSFLVGGLNMGFFDWVRFLNPKTSTNLLEMALQP